MTVLITFVKAVVFIATLAGGLRPCAGGLKPCVVAPHHHHVSSGQAK